MADKPKVAFYWCGSCGGCEESVVDLAEDILPVVEAVDIVFWPVALDFKRSDVEAMEDQSILASFINGAICTEEQKEMAELLRKKSQLLIAYGSCAHTGGIPGLANFYTRQETLERAYFETPSTDNPDKVLPSPETTVPEGRVTIPRCLATVHTLDQVVDVDFYLPGCPPPVRLIKEALNALLSGDLPPKGTVLAPDIAQCEECPRKESKPDKLLISEVKRPYEVEIDPEKCFLEQGLICLGPVTRAGCDHPCIDGNMPCTGCLGATSRVWDYGGKAISFLASIFDATTEEEIQELLSQCPDLPGMIYRYSLPASLLRGKTQSKEEQHA